MCTSGVCDTKDVINQLFGHTATQRVALCRNADYVFHIYIYIYHV